MDTKKTVKYISIIGISILLILILILPKLGKDDADDPRGAGERKINPVISVNAMVIKPREMTSVFLTSGTLLSNEETELRSEVAGRVIEINFTEGSFVQKGTLLVKLNDAELTAQLRKDQSALELAKDKEYRQKILFEKNATSKEIYDAAQNELNAIKAEIEYLKALILKTEIRAPFDGKIGLRNVSVGSYISPSTVIASFQDADPIKLDFAIPQKYSDYISRGTQVRFKTPSDGKLYKATVYAIEPRIDATSRTLRIRAICPNTRGDLIPGGFADVELTLSGLDHSLAAPTEALLQDIKGEKLFLYKEGKATPVTVKTGIRTDSEIQIISGLTAGDTIITTGIIQLRPGAKVKISELLH